MAPQRIGKYEVTGKLGQGAMGEVLRAHDPVLNRDVAVKRISAGLDTDENVRKRFRREAEAAAKLNHPNIITVYELGFEGEQLYMAMELLDGADLKQALAGRLMTLDQKLDVMEQICEGLAFAHAHEIVHRDLKPANIHILPSGKVKIMDFGLARVSGSEMTTTGMVMGTPHYMSPEQVRGLKADARSDIFALGCVFYEMLTGRKPFDAESMHGVLYKVMQEEPPPLREAAPGTPEALAEVVEAALTKDPSGRQQNASEMLAALRHARQAMAAGRGHERIADVERPPAAPVVREPARAAARSHSAGVARQTKPPSTAAGSRRGLLVGAVLGLVALLAGAWVLRGWLAGSPAAAPAAAPEVSSLAQAVVDSQVELARRRLDSGDATDAARQAERALKLDPKNAAARQVLDEASAVLRRVDEAVSAVRAAGSDRERLADAALALMTLDPAHPEAERAATAAGPAFRSRADAARRLEQQARRDAEAAGQGGTPAFAAGVDLERQGDRDLQSGQAVSAARRFLEARSRFDHARGPSR